MPSEFDNPGVIAPPPLLFGGTLALGLLLEFSVARLRTGMPNQARDWIAAGLVAVAIAIVARALLSMRRARTNVEPWKPTTSIVTDGSFGHTRNPIYLGMALVYAAVALAFDSMVALILLVPLLVVVDRLVVAREERYLDAKFGEPYRRYRSAVRRWV